MVMKRSIKTRIRNVNVDINDLNSYHIGVGVLSSIDMSQRFIASCMYIKPLCYLNSCGMESKRKAVHTTKDTYFIDYVQLS